MFKLVNKLIGGYLSKLSAYLGGDAARRRRLARQQAKRILSELRILRFTARTKKGKLQTVQFEYPLLLTREEVWCPIDLQRRPAGIDTTMFRDEAVLKSLEDRCHAAVRIDTLANGKLCYVVRLAGASFPEVFGIGAFKLPPEAPPLAIPMGMNGQGEHIWKDLAALPHLLVVGSTGKGKSNFVHALLCTWIERNTAQDIQIWLADHKGGVELHRYEVLMGSKSTPGIVRRYSDKAEDTIVMLEAAVKEMTRRMALLRQADASDVDDYLRQTGQHLPRIAIVIDEIYFLMLNKEKIDPQIGSGKGGQTIAKWAENLFSRIASAGRAPGVHLVIATQKTGKDVLTSLITANFESRVVFATADMYQSIYVLGTAEAVGLPAGRIMFRGEAGETTEIQTPRIAPQQTRLVVNRIAKYGPGGGLGRADEERRFIADAKLLILAASEQLNGDFARSKVLALEGIRGVITRDRFDEIVARLERDGVLESGGPRKPRRIARGYYGRPQLLDVLYGDTGAPASAHSDPVTSAETYGMAEKDTGYEHQDAEKPAARKRADTGYGMRNSGNHAPAGSDDDSDIDLGPWSDLLNRPLDEEDE